MRMNLYCFGLALWCMTGVLAPAVTAENTRSEPADRAKVAMPVYSYQVNGHVLQVEWNLQSRVAVTYDGTRMPVVTSADGWSVYEEMSADGSQTSEASRLIGFTGYFWEYYDGEQTVPVAHIEWTGGDEFLELKFVEIVADETAAEVFGVDVGEVIDGNFFVSQWDLVPSGWTSPGSETRDARTARSLQNTPSDAQQVPNPVFSTEADLPYVSATKCGCFRGSRGPATCTQTNCNNTDSCGTTGVCMEVKTE